MLGAGNPQQPALFKPFSDLNPEPPGKMCVAGTRVGQAARCHRPFPGLRPRRKHQQRLNRIRHLRARQAIVPVPSLSLHAEQASIDQPCKMAARRLRCDICDRGELSRRQGQSVHQAKHDRGPSRVTQQIRGQ